MAGYSGTPLPRKLGLRSGFRVYLVHLPIDARVQLQAELSACEQVDRGEPNLDLAMVFTTLRTELWEELRSVTRVLAPAGMVWACWPRKSSGTSSELDEDGVRGIGLRSGLVDVKVCAVTETWSGLKFVRRTRDRAGPGR